MTERVLPTGTVTFLFSDIEGSTRLVQQLGPELFGGLLELHNRLLRDAFASHDGVERGTQGDSFLVMFREAPAAVAAAAEAQRALQVADWPGATPVRVRMGMHTGLGTLGGDDYVSVDVHRAARIAHLAHGGQVLLSDATRVLAQDRLPPGVATRPLGEHVLRDLDRPERIHQLVVDGVPADFPPLRAAHRAPGNLPVPLTSFVGRAAALAEAGALLEDHRLVTLTGPGGAGKTRLAIELARAAADRFDDGVWFVPLDATRDPDMVPARIATTFGLLEAPGSGPLERVGAFLADRSLLLVLDNFEQVVEAGPPLADLLRLAPGLHLLITSRTPLRLSMEQEYAVRPLAVPQAVLADDAMTADAVRLFVERARRVRAGFEPSSPVEVAAIVEICRRLDGLPLGIELAAARVGLLDPVTIAERLAGRLDLPGAGTRDLPERQRSLDATIAWSHNLLGPGERRLLARMSVFAGGARLEEIDAVASGSEADDAIEALSVLVDHNLVQPVEAAAGRRFRLLETIRIFAAQRLAEAGEEAAIRRRHAEAYLALAEEAARHMPAAGQVPWLELLAAEHDNLHAALDWAIEAGEVVTAHRFVAALWRYWQFRGHMTQGTAVTARVLAMRGADEPSPWRMRALDAAGGLAWWTADLAAADAWYVQQLAIARAIGDREGTADALFNLSHTRFDPTAGQPSEEVDAIRSEARAIYTDLGDDRSLARLDWTIGYGLLAEGRLDDATEQVRLAHDRFERGGDAYYEALAAGALGTLALARGDVSTAFRLGVRSIRTQVGMGDTASATLALRAAAAMLLMVGLIEEAAVANGAYGAHARRYGYRPPVDVEAWVSGGMTGAEIDEILGTPELAAARALGAAMTLEEYVARLEDLERAGITPAAPATPPTQG